MATDNLIDRKIVNYLRRNASNNENQNQIRNKLLGLFYKTVEGFPINVKLTDDEYKEKLGEFPLFFQNKTREELLELFNLKVCPRKPIKYPFTLIDYDIKENSYLVISPKTLRPVYQSDWKEQAEELNKIEIRKQQSFYAHYLRYYLQKKEFPTFNQYLNYIYNKTQKPLHKDIKIVFDNIDNSYEPIKDFIKINNMSHKDNKELLIKSTSIPMRIQMQS